MHATFLISVAWSDLLTNSSLLLSQLLDPPVPPRPEPLPHLHDGHRLARGILHLYVIELNKRIEVSFTTK